MNKLTNYSNGQTQITRTFPGITEKKRISVPFKKGNLGDAVATLAVFGDVSITEPPSFPSGQKDNSLAIDSQNVDRDLGVKLSGANVRIVERGGQSHTGRLIGINQIQQKVDNAIIQTFEYVILTDSAERKSFAQMDVSGVVFIDAEVQAEIRAALDRNFQKIKPDSTFVELTLEPIGKTSGSIDVQYTIPTSAWQPTYQLRLVDKKASLECNAKVDNPTDEDWKEFVVSVAVGDPNTFATDLADIRCPRRSKVFLVNENAQGNINVEEGMDCDLDESDAGGNQYGLESLRMTKGGGGRAVRAQSMAQYASGSASIACASAYAPAATRAEAETKDVGDFAIFTTKNPVDILAGRSAVVPLFEESVDGEPILVFKPTTNRERPFRAVKFKNTTAHSLGKGNLVVYDEGIYAGQVVLEATKPGEERILPHAKENGVKVAINPTGSNGGVHERRRTRVEIAKGLVKCDEIASTTTVYKIKNNKPEAFKLQLEYTKQYGAGSVVTVEAEISAPIQAITDGVRVAIDLPANKTIDVKLIETLVQKQEVGIESNGGWPWLKSFLNSDGASKLLTSRKSFKEVAAAAKAVDDANDELQEKTKEINMLKGEQARLLELTKSGAGGSAKDEWHNELVTNEKAIKKGEREEIPALNKLVKEANKVLSSAIKELSESWIEESGKK